MFEFAHIKPWDRGYLDKPGAQVVFATPGMLHAGMRNQPNPILSVHHCTVGTSLELFKAWCGSERNMVIMPGYCVAGTIGNKVLSGQKQVW